MTKRQLMKGFKRPSEMVLEEKKREANTKRFVASPYERGMGTSIGNTLRRVLLSSIEGYAIVAVNITYAKEDDATAQIGSEFQAIPHVKEDTIEVIANLKGCRINLADNADSCTYDFEVKSAGPVTAAVLAANPNIKILNPDHPLLTAMDGVNATFSIQIDRGVGYKSAEEAAHLVEEIGTLPIDAIYSPIVHVGMKVEKVRVGNKTDYDKLILEVETDGTISPEDALSEAAKIAKEHLTLFINFDEREVEVVAYSEEIDESVLNILNTPVSSLELSARSDNCLTANGITNLGELIACDEQKIAEMRNFGKKSLDEIKEKLVEWNLKLGMKDISAIVSALKNPKAPQ